MIVLLGVGYTSQIECMCDKANVHTHVHLYVHVHVYLSCTMSCTLLLLDAHVFTFLCRLYVPLVRGVILNQPHMFCNHKCKVPFYKMYMYMYNGQRCQLISEYMGLSLSVLVY